MGKKIVLSTSGVRTTGYPYGKKMNLDTDLTLCTKINSIWIVYLNVKCKIIKLLEDNIGENLGDFEFSNEFLDTPPKESSMKKKLVSYTSLKLKTDQWKTPLRE